MITQKNVLTNDLEKLERKVLYGKVYIPFNIRKVYSEEEGKEDVQVGQLFDQKIYTLEEYFIESEEKNIGSQLALVDLHQRMLKANTELEAEVTALKERIEALEEKGDK